MNDDYLWNKTGEPDPEVEELEKILGVLRYRPKTLVLPRDIPVQRSRNFYPLLAVAATVVLSLLAAGIWFSVKRGNAPRTETATKIEATPQHDPTNAPGIPEKSQLIKNEEQSEPTATGTSRQQFAFKPRLVANKQPDREEALAAKEQLLLALRLASEKLNEARRRTQPPNQNRNQHKVG